MLRLHISAELTPPDARDLAEYLSPALRSRLFAGTVSTLAAAHILRSLLSGSDNDISDRILYGTCTHTANVIAF